MLVLPVDLLSPRKKAPSKQAKAKRGRRQKMFPEVARVSQGRHKTVVDDSGI